MVASKKSLLMILTLVMVLFEQGVTTDDSCEIMIQKNNKGKSVLHRSTCNNSTSECLEIKEGRYICEQRCTSYLYEAIGFGIAIGLLLVVLSVVIIGWVITCWLMHKTTDFSIKPKNLIPLNRHEETPSETNTSFQPLTKYSNFGPSYEKADRQLMSTEGEGIYEVVDGKETKPKMKRSIGKDRNVMITGGHTEPYNTLKFEEY